MVETMVRLRSIALAVCILLGLLLSAAPVSVAAQGAEDQAEFNALVGSVDPAALLFGPASGSLSLADGPEGSITTGVNATDVLVHVDIEVPETGPGELWAIDVAARVTDDATYLRVWSDGEWLFWPGGTEERLEGTGLNLPTTAGSTFAIDLAVQGTTGFFALDGQVVTRIDLSTWQTAGDVALYTAEIDVADPSSVTIPYSSLTVFELAPVTTPPVASPPAETPTEAAVVETPTEAAGVETPTEAAGAETPGPAAGLTGAAAFDAYLQNALSLPVVFGPEDGQIAYEDDRVAFLETNVDPQNFVARFECVAPISQAEGLWDCGIVFREGPDGAYRLGVISDGSWFLSIGSGETVQFGQGLALDANPGGKTTINLVADGETGYLGINGEFVETLDLSALPDAGPIALAAGFFTDTTVPGGSVAYEDLIIWTLDQASAAPTEAAVETPTEAAAVVTPTEAATEAAAETPTSVAAEPTPAAVVPGAGDAAVFDQLMLDRESRPVVFGPDNGALIHDPARVPFERAGVSVLNLGAHIACSAPGVDPTAIWDCGLAIRLGEAADDQYRVVVFSNGAWLASQGTGTIIAQGEGLNVPSDPGGQIVIDLYAIDETGYFGVNGEYVTTLDFSAVVSPGDVAAGTGFLADSTIEGGVTVYQDFTIWSFDQEGAGPAATVAPVETPTEVATVVPAETPTEVATVAPVETPTEAAAVETPLTIAGDAGVLAQVLQEVETQQPVFGPQDGTMIHDPERVTFERSGVNLQDLAAHLECIAPIAPEEGLWDCGIAFRLGTGAGEQFRIVFNSNGQWFLSHGSEGALQRGSDLAVDASLGAVTTLDLVAIGDTGYFAVNGQYVDTLDLSLLVQPGNVAAGTAFVDEAYIPGGATGYQAFTVWSLEEVPVAPTEAPAVATEAPTEAPVVATEVPAAPTTAGEQGATAVVVLEPVGNSAVRGFGTVSGVERTVQVDLLMIGTQPGDLVTVYRGSCSAVTAGTDPDYIVGELNEAGVLNAEVRVRLTVLLNRDTYAVVVFGAADENFAQPLACGEITGS